MGTVRRPGLCAHYQAALKEDKWSMIALPC